MVMIVSLIQMLLITLMTKVAVLNFTDEGDVSSTVSITQNASGRLGTMDAVDETAYRQAKETLRNPDSIEENLQSKKCGNAAHLERGD